MDLRDTRELALERLARFCRSGFVSVTDFRHDPLRIFAAHECAAIIDPSMATKMTVSARTMRLPGKVGWGPARAARRRIDTLQWLDMPVVAARSCRKVPGLVCRPLTALWRELTGMVQSHLEAACAAGNSRGLRLAVVGSSRGRQGMALIPGKVE
jgi:hypothetical protein